MALSLRKRGEIWHARGTVRTGREVVHVAEFSTGCRARADAEAAAEAEARRIRDAALDGPAGRARGLSVADCILAYAGRPRGVSRLDAAKFDAINDAIGAYRLDTLREAWAAWQAAHPHHAPATAIRYRALLLAAVRSCCAASGVPAPTLPAIAASREERLVYLTEAERAALLRSYSPHAACPVLLLAYQGMRTQEALQLDWRLVDWATDTLRVGAARAKSRRARAIPMHPRVRMLLWGMWHAAGRPQAGPVFRNSRGDRWADTQDEGGNPLRSAHATACRRAGLTGFRVHDWRHDWAARCVMSGMDLFTLMRLGGWSSLAMVERYGAVSGAHMAEAIRRIA
jgi:integrase